MNNFNPDNINIASFSQKKVSKEKPILENNEILTNLSEKMERKLSIYTPDPNDFRDVYSDESVDMDIRYAEALEEKWKFQRKEMAGPQRNFVEREKKKALITEAIMINQLSGGWLNFGEGSSVSVVAAPTSKPDDYGIINKSRKGFDLSLEFINNNDSHLDTYAGASIDITSGNEETVKKKIFQIVEIIKSGETPIIKYFENDAETFKGSIEVAPFVLVLSNSTVEDLFKKELKSNKQELEDHPVQLSLLIQLKEQAETFLVLSRKYQNQELKKSYQQALNHIDDLLLEKKEYHESLDVDINSLEERYQGLKSLHKAILESLLKEV